VSRFELSVSGELAGTLLDLIESRFGKVTTGTTTITVDDLDPAAERALLNLLWDTGHDVIATHSTR
jgi:hypothetical protein